MDSKHRKEEVEDLEATEAESVRKIEGINQKIKDVEATIPVVRNVEGPTGDDVEKHMASGHANFRRWCPACQKGWATRGPHRRTKKVTYSRNEGGDIKVVDTEVASEGWTKLSIDYGGG